MIVINYFDWSGTRDGLMRWAEAVQGECERHNIEFLGLSGPSQVKFNWCFIHNVKSQEHYHRAWSELGIPVEVTYSVIHYFWPEESFRRDLPKYPPAHFLEVG